jgi:single-stranded-DNA-specific exonuclease
MSNYRWKFRQRADESTIHNLANILNIPKSLANVLAVRGVFSTGEAEKFFEPKLEDLNDPFLMDGMETAIYRILKAVRSKETIWIHGDYDVDGTASTAMLMEFLQEIGGKVFYFIPDRFNDGYGLSINSINKAISKGASLIITVDLGITSYDTVDYANKSGIDTIICDHHEPGESLPDAYAILDPIKPDCPYPFKQLAACGVVFKLIQAISIHLGIEEKAYSFLDYVAIASAADMVPMINENRIFSYYGLQILNKNPRPGFKGLIECTNLRTGTITASSIIHALAPLINAAGRLGDASRAVEMMTQSDELSAFRIAQELEQENRRRRVLDEKTFDETIPIADKIIAERNPRSLVIHSPQWHAGVIGIVASRLVDRYHLPSIVLTTVDGLAKGSARSIPDFDIHKALKTCSQYLVEFGGHKHAAGLTLQENRVGELREAFDSYADQYITKDMLEAEILIDSELDLSELSPSFFNILKKFAPFGYDNYRPVFLSKGVISANGIKVVGNNHLKFRAYQSNFVIDAIGYNLAAKINLCTNRKAFSIVYNLEETVISGHTNIQLRIKDIHSDVN